jgi:hypothetical protein
MAGSSCSQPVHAYQPPRRQERPRRALVRDRQRDLRWAQMMLLSVKGMDVPATAKFLFTGFDRVRDVIGNFNTNGIRLALSVGPRAAAAGAFSRRRIANPTRLQELGPLRSSQARNSLPLHLQ